MTKSTPATDSRQASAVVAEIMDNDDNGKITRVKHVKAHNSDHIRRALELLVRETSR